MRRRWAATTIVIALSISGCGLLASFDGFVGNDAGLAVGSNTNPDPTTNPDAGVDASTSRSIGELGFVVVPGTLDLFAGATATIKIVLDQPATSVIRFVLRDLFPGGSATELSILESETSGTLTLTANEAPQFGHATIRVVGTKGETTAGTANLAVRVLGRAAFSSSGRFTIPTNVDQVMIKAWGAGGGAGSAAGGGGGYAECLLTAKAGDALDVDVGRGGASGYNVDISYSILGGGGGGFSRVSRSGVDLLIAAGGGGGGTTTGGAGGGATGLAGTTVDNVAGGQGGSSLVGGAGGAAIADGGGGSPGGSKLGGIGAGTMVGASGGAPGGARGGGFPSGDPDAPFVGGGGGGGGYFGGGGGGAGRVGSTSKGTGGGGGSSFGQCTTPPTLIAGSGAIPPKLDDPDSDAGGPVVGRGGVAETGGGTGRVVIVYGL